MLAINCIPGLIINMLAEFDEYEVKHHLLHSIEWKESGISDNKVTVYKAAKGKWKNIAQCLGLEPSEIQHIERDKHDNHDRVVEVFLKWLENANQLPRHTKYPKKWSGLIRLLKDSELGQLAEDLQSALTAPVSDVKGNFSPSASS